MKTKTQKIKSKEMKGKPTTSLPNAVSDGIYAVMQSVAKKGCNLKVYYRETFVRGELTPVPAIFIRKTDAEVYLANVIKTVKAEIKSGDRSANNLDPETSLDFCIVPIGVVFNREIVESRGWDCRDQIHAIKEIFTPEQLEKVVAYGAKK